MEFRIKFMRILSIIYYKIFLKIRILKFHDNTIVIISNLIEVSSSNIRSIVFRATIFANFLIRICLVYIVDINIFSITFSSKLV